jgi:hypothetical protein
VVNRASSKAVANRAAIPVKVVNKGGNSNKAEAEVARAECPTQGVNRAVAVANKVAGKAAKVASKAEVRVARGRTATNPVAGRAVKVAVKADRATETADARYAGLCAAAKLLILGSVASVLRRNCPYEFVTDKV